MSHIAAGIYASAERKLFGKHPHDQQYHADGYCRIGAVKGRPVVAVPVEVDKIDHLPPPDPVDQVADGTPENEGKGNGGIEALRPETAQEIKNKGYGSKGGKDEQNGLRVLTCPEKMPKAMPLFLVCRMVRYCSMISSE